ncbi:hypothetical protein ABNQ39_00115 (plasmid) [Azospirillum sp. A26]|uniref:hypothetical protein n=1 Tax=Azospirillum sp. A26 TaxID=3160607 RepID=UPI00366FEA62
MTETVSFASNVLRQLDDAVSSAKSTILAGSAQDFPEYRRLTGRLAGLEEARATIVKTLGDDAKHLHTERRE